MNLEEIRNYVRTQLDVDEEEYPNLLLDSYAREGFITTVATESRWPFYENTWNVVKELDSLIIEVPPDCDPVGIDSLVDLETGYRLVMVATHVAEDRFVGLSAPTLPHPAFYSISGSSIELWPEPESAERVFRLRGHRYPTDWVSEGAGAEPDWDRRLDFLLLHYIIGLMYAQQEDEVLGDVAMRRWEQSLGTVRKAIMAPRHHQPLIYAGGLPYRPASRVVWDLPVA